jgi:hypothetical protein
MTPMTRVTMKTEFRQRYAVREYGISGHPLSRGYVVFLGEIPNDPGHGLFIQFDRPDAEYGHTLVGNIEEFEEA